MSQAEGTIATAAKGNSAITNYTKYVESYQKKVLAKDQDAMIMPFLSNHDMDRIAGAFVTENNMKMAANLYLLCSGSPVIYYGEEIGMRGSRGSANTDANRRLAMLWGDGDPVRDPVGSTYPANKQISTTVKDQSEDEGSMLSYYRELISIRHRYPAIARGIYTSLDCKEKNLGGFLIEYEGEAIVLLHNTSAVDTLSVDLASLAALDGVDLSKIGDYIGQGKATLKGTVLTLEPQTSVIIK
jgi:glycosidase